jgi:hypothetical protein
MQFGIKVVEWNGYVCQAETHPFDYPPLFRVKILDLPASADEVRKREQVLNIKPQHGPAAIHLVRKEKDGWYMNLPYPTRLVDQAPDDLRAEASVLLHYFSQGIGVSVELG